MRWVVFLLAVILSFSFSKEPSLKFHKVTAAPGDGAYTLLRRYQLMQHDCNVKKFYELNALSDGQPLIKGRSYYLPVLLYQYNGKSIRSTLGIDDWDLATRIASFNKQLLRNNLRRTAYESSRILWVPYHELHCGASYAIKSTEGTVDVPLFGEAFSTVKLRSSQLNGKVFYIVSGHGGPDPGAMANVNGSALCEDEYAYDVSLRLARNLMEQGATVQVIIQDPNDGIRTGEYLKCDREELCMGVDQIPLMQVNRLRQRTHAINKMYGKYLAEGITDQRVVCIHVDSRNPQRREDVFFYHFEKSKTGRKMANNLHKTFKEKYQKHRSNGEYHGSVSTRNLFMLRETDAPAVYIELANIKNSADRRRIMPEANRQALANWIYEGLVR